MNNPDLGIYLLHIADSCEKILWYLQTWSKLTSSKTTWFRMPFCVTLKSLERRQNMCRKNTAIDIQGLYWRGMAGLRDIPDSPVFRG